MKINLRDYNPGDWAELEDIILNAENFGEVFLESEKRKITVFTSSPEFGRVLVAENAANG